MQEIRIHGRGGQGAVIASILIAHAAHHAGYHVRAFPEFGVERRGAPVTAFARIDRAPILLRTRIDRPDHVVVLDPALARTTPVDEGLRDDGAVVLNAPDLDALASIRGPWRVAWVDATAIAARRGIGTPTYPIVNTAMVGAFAGASGLLAPEHVEKAIVEVLGKAAPPNVEAAMDAYRDVRILVSPVSGALQALLEGGGR